jgi:uncharacterized membrane protein
MSDGIWSTLLLTAALACGLAGGVFYAFSTFVMRALVALPPAQGLAAMQAINRAVYNVPFMSVFGGAAALCVAVVAGSATGWAAPGAGWALAGALLYLVGTFGVTAVFHVPRNNALDRVREADPDAGDRWRQYARTWTLGNHLRTAAAVVATGLLTWALHVSG